MSSRDIVTRVGIVEEGLKSITLTLVDMRADMKEERREIAQAFESLKSNLGARARPFPFKEVGAAVTLTIAVLGGAVSVLNWWADAKNALITEKVNAIYQMGSPEELAVLKYRMKLLEDTVRAPMASR